MITAAEFVVAWQSSKSLSEFVERSGLSERSARKRSYYYRGGLGFR